MFAVNAVRRAAAVAIRTESRRNASAYNDVVCSGPLYRISFAEKVFHGVLLTIGVMAYPVYAMSEMAKIKREEYAALEIPEQWLEWKEKQKK